MAAKLIVAPAAEPITRQQAKRHLRLIVNIADETPHPEDALVDTLIVAARQGVEHITGRALMPQTWELALDEFDDVIELPKPPFVSITTVKYLDADGVLQPLASSSYLLDDYGVPARIMPAFGASWPSTRRQANAVLIRYAAGYADANAVPHPIKSWMLLRIGTLYENRESLVKGTTSQELANSFVDRLLDPYRVWSL